MLFLELTPEPSLLSRDLRNENDFQKRGVLDFTVDTDLSFSLI